MEFVEFTLVRNLLKCLLHFGTKRKMTMNKNRMYAYFIFLRLFFFLVKCYYIYKWCFYLFALFGYYQLFVSTPHFCFFFAKVVCLHFLFGVVQRQCVVNPENHPHRLLPEKNSGGKSVGKKDKEKKIVAWQKWNVFSVKMNHVSFERLSVFFSLFFLYSYEEMNENTQSVS